MTTSVKELLGETTVIGQFPKPLIGTLRRRTRQSQLGRLWTGWRSLAHQDIADRARYAVCRLGRLFAMPRSFAEQAPATLGRSLGAAADLDPSIHVATRVLLQRALHGVDGCVGRAISRRRRRRRRRFFPLLHPLAMSRA
jgi:hypothetical protein